MAHSGIEVILLADAPNALTELCGITLLERLLRIVQRLGFERVTVISATSNAIAGALAKPSWARAKLVVDVVANPVGVEAATSAAILKIAVAAATASTAQRWLIIPAGIYCDARLLAALCRKNANTVLVDSGPPELVRALLETFPQTARGRLCGPAFLMNNSLAATSSNAPFFQQLKDRIDNIDVVDAATEPDYVVSMRRHVRPLCFPAPSANHRRVAERVVLDSAQNGTLDIPAYAHASIENWIVSRLSRTTITPNQVTTISFLVGCIATVAFATGHLWLGTLIALLFGVLDGVDGKLARVKVETTERGKWEHKLDYLIENSWWVALAFHLWSSGRLPNAFYLFALLIGSDLVDRLAKKWAKHATGLQLDDVAPFDRAFRLIAGRRNIYAWMLAGGLLLGAVDQTYAAICVWAAVTAAVHLLRYLWIRGRTAGGSVPV